MSARCEECEGTGLEPGYVTTEGAPCEGCGGTGRGPEPKDSGDYQAAGRDPSRDLLNVLEHAEADLANMLDELHVRATRDALACVRTALDIVRGQQP